MAGYDQSCMKDIQTRFIADHRVYVICFRKARYTLTMARSSL
jgi:hypothetical protein